MRERLFKWIANLVWKRPWTVVIIAVALSAICLVYASNKLELNANTDDLIAANRPFMVEYRAFLEEFGDLEYIWVVIENTGDVARTQQIVDALTRKLRDQAALPHVYGFISPQEQLRIATRARKSRDDPAPAMSNEELTNLIVVSDAFPTILTGDADAVLRKANQRLQQLIQQGSQLPPDEQERLGASATFLLNAIAMARASESASARLLDSLMLANRQPEYFTSETGRFYFITIIPEKDYSTLSVIEKPLRRIRAVIDDVRRDFPGVNIGLTGKPVLQADEMATTNDDMTKASIIAFVLVAILFMWSFGGIWKPLLAVLAFACGGAWTYGAATLLVGQLNLLSIVFMLVLIGVGLDYGIHILSRYKENRRSMEVRTAVEGAIHTAVRGNLTGALTSAAVFLMALFTSFQGLRELGLIAGLGLLLCFAALAIVLPALIVVVDRRKTAPEAPAIGKEQSRASRMFDGLRRRPAAVLIALAAMTLVFVFVPGQLRFERNLLELQAQGLESIEWEHRILQDSASASWFGASIADSQAQLLDITARAQQQPNIGTVRSVFDVIHPPLQGREELRSQLRLPANVDAMQTEPSPATFTADDVRAAIQPLNFMAVGAASRAPEFANLFQQLARDLNVIADQIAGQGENAQRIRAQIGWNVHELAVSLETILHGNLMTMREALPDALRAQYISTSGRFLVMLHPKHDVWDADAMKAFIDDLREVDPDITGAPITHYESLNDMERSFLQMSIYALLAIAVIVFLDFRTLKGVLLSIVPTAFGLAWLVEIMGLLDISFNLANFFALPILIGLSVDGSVHMLHRYYEAGEDRLRFGATRRAVIVTALTTTIGFGALMIAQHRGLQSLGAVMAIGSVTCLIATVIILPALLGWLERHRVS